MSFIEGLLRTGAVYQHHLAFVKQAVGAAPEQRARLLTEYVKALSDMAFAGFKATLLLQMNNHEYDAGARAVIAELLRSADAARNDSLRIGQPLGSDAPTRAAMASAPANDVDADVALVNGWFNDIPIETDRKKAVLEHLLKLNAEGFAHFSENLQTIRDIQLQNIKQHHEDEKYAWGRFFEDQMAYLAAKDRTGAQDPTWKKNHLLLEEALGKVDWTIKASADLWAAIQRAASKGVT